jgi:hypothetical protein
MNQNEETKNCKRRSSAASVVQALEVRIKSREENLGHLLKSKNAELCEATKRRADAGDIMYRTPGKRKPFDGRTRVGEAV